jgi:predicted ATP-binding protein involved in virulence
MKINKLRMQNFRSHTDLSIEFHEKLTVIVGENGSGKTSLLDSLTIALGPILNRLPFEKKAKVPSLTHSDIRQTDKDQKAPFVRLDINAEHGPSRFEWDRTRLRDNSASTKAEAEQPKKELKELYSYVDRLTDAHNRKESYDLPVFAIYGTSRAVDVPQNRLQKRVLPKAFARLAGLENALSPRTDFRLSVGSFELLETRALRENRDNPGASSPPAALHAIRTAIERVIPNVSNPRMHAIHGRFMVDVLKDDGVTLELYLDQLSDGYQIMLGVVMDFSTRLALAAPQGASAEQILATPALLIIDEVELHLHPRWQQRVIADISRVFPGVQLIVTTHSPQVVTTVPSECIRILKDGKVHAAPAGTDGAEAQRILESVFQVNRRPNTEMSRALDQYLRLVDQREWETPKALELRAMLNKWSQGQEPRLLEADLQIENLKWEMGK